MKILSRLCLLVLATAVACSYDARQLAGPPADGSGAGTGGSGILSVDSSLGIADAGSGDVGVVEIDVGTISDVPLGTGGVSGEGGSGGYSGTVDAGAGGSGKFDASDSSTSGPDSGPYAIFKITITSSTSPRTSIAKCQMLVTDEGGNLVDSFILQPDYVVNDSGVPVLVQGCSLGLTNSMIGTFTYNTSRTSGTLTFEVDALDSNNCVVQTASSADQAIQAYPPQIPVPVTIRSTGNCGDGGIGPDVAGTGGVIGTGGVTGTPVVDASAVGGAIGSGGIIGAGGATGIGGNPGTGGILGAGGASSNCPPDPGTSSGTVNFCNGKAQGVMSGYAWADLGMLDTITSPTCGGAPITDQSGIKSCTPAASTWNVASSLCITGRIPVVVGGDYTDNWGLQIDVYTADPPATSPGSGTLGKAYSTITLNTTGQVTPTNTAVRAYVHLAGTTSAVSYCATMMSGRAITLTSFNTACWDGSGTALKSADIPNIDWVGIQISSDDHSNYTVTDFCLTSIQFGI